MSHLVDEEFFLFHHVNDFTKSIHNLPTPPSKTQASGLYQHFRTVLGSR